MNECSNERLSRLPMAVGDEKYFVDAAGDQHFTSRRQVWLDPAVPMAYTSQYTTALETLAVNLLMLVAPPVPARRGGRRRSATNACLAPLNLR